MVLTSEKFHELFPTSEDPILSSFLFLLSRVQLAIITLTYLLFVLKLGPILMQNRRAFDLKYVMIVYNFLQVVLNLIVFLQVLQIVPQLSIICTPMAQSSTSSGKIGITLNYYYFLLKLLDLLDTIFFVLRKKQNQVSYLHLHHHVGMFVGTWFSLRYFPAGQTTFIGVYNTFVHSVMYGYYLATCLSTKDFWWKKYVTLLQIAQHYLTFLCMVFAFLNPNCSYPKGWLGLILLNTISIIYMFTRFYALTYINKSVKSQ